PGDSDIEQSVESQTHVPINSRDSGEEGAYDRLGTAKGAQVELWRSKLQRTQHWADEARVGGRSLGLPTHERKETRRAYGQTRYRLDIVSCFSRKDYHSRHGSEMC